MEYHAARGIPERAEAWLSTARAEKFKEYISPGDRVLEYGVGFGWNLAAIKCAEKTGFDPVSNLAESVARKGVRFISVEGLLPTLHFDTVIAHHVLEHVRRPVAVLRFLRTLIRPGGKLLLQVPFEREPRYKKWRNEKAHHIYSWTPETISKSVRESGWRVAELRLSKFRFDRWAAVVALRCGGNYAAYRIVRGITRSLLPEYEIFLLAK